MSENRKKVQIHCPIQTKKYRMLLVCTIKIIGCIQYTNFYIPNNRSYWEHFRSFTLRYCVVGLHKSTIEFDKRNLKNKMFINSEKKSSFKWRMHNFFFDSFAAVACRCRFGSSILLFICLYCCHFSLIIFLVSFFDFSFVRVHCICALFKIIRSSFDSIFVNPLKWRQPNKVHCDKNIYIRYLYFLLLGRIIIKPYHPTTSIGTVNDYVLFKHFKADIFLHICQPKTNSNNNFQI